MKLVHAISSTTIVQEAVANFVKTGKYESHLWQFRRRLESNCQHYMWAIIEYFPKGTRTTKPQGGLAIYIEFNKNIDAVQHVSVLSFFLFDYFLYI